eukprot:scaffold11737_cov57-Phaeocystis_antarctica.AAC.2
MDTNRKLLHNTLSSPRPGRFLSRCNRSLPFREKPHVSPFSPSEVAPACSACYSVIFLRNPESPGLPDHRSGQNSGRYTIVPP